MGPELAVHQREPGPSSHDLDTEDEVGVVKPDLWAGAGQLGLVEQEGPERAFDGRGFQAALHPPQPGADMKAFAGKQMGMRLEDHTEGLGHIITFENRDGVHRLDTDQAFTNLRVPAGGLDQAGHRPIAANHPDQDARIARRPHAHQWRQGPGSLARHTLADHGQEVPVTVINHRSDNPPSQLCSQPRPRLIVAAMRRAAGRALVAVFVLAIGGAAGCGAGGGTATTLPAAGQTSAGQGNLVLYVAQADGDRIDAYRLGNDGLLPAEPFSTLAVTNPRRLTVSGNMLYASLGTSVISLVLASDGSLPATTSASTTPSLASSPMEVLVRNGVLYAAVSGRSRIETYTLDSDGHVGEDTLSISNPGFRNYRTLTTYGDYLYAAARAAFTIDTYLIQGDGSLPETFETQLPMPIVTMPEDITANAGIIYAIDQNNERINSYTIDDDGLLPSLADSVTDPEERYGDLLVDNGRIYASAYSAGRIDTYLLASDGSLPSGKPAAATHADTASFPAALTISGAVLYVAQAGLDRVDAYLLDTAGNPTSFPSSSTYSMAGSFPTDIELYTLP